MSYTFSGICPRCGQVTGTWHTQAACDAAYDRAYRGYQTTPVQQVVVQPLMKALQPERKWVVHRKATQPLEVEAQTLKVTEGGALVFDEGAFVVSPVGYLFAEEEDTED